MADKEYVSVHIQFVQDNYEKIIEMAQELGGGTLSFKAVDEAISQLAEVRMPRLPYPTYISRGNEVGDIVSVPYGKDFWPIGVVVEKLSEKDVDVDSGITYKPVAKTLLRGADYA